MEDEFDKAFKWGKRIAIIWGLIVIGLISFGVWVVIKILQHFEVV